MTDADAIWESKLSRLQVPNPEKMKPLVELIGEATPLITGAQKYTNGVRRIRGARL